MAGTDDPSLFNAVSPSATQLSYLLRCLSFAPKAQVKITADGLRFSAEDGSVMEAFIFLSKELFSSYTYQYDDPTTQADDEPPMPSSLVFSISLPGLIETLQIFAVNDSNNFSSANTAYSSSARPTDSLTAHRLQRHAGTAGISALSRGTAGLCSLTYTTHGSPLSVHLTDTGVRTTCDLTTYEVSNDSRADIPFDRDSLRLKTITRASVLADAIQELAASGPPAALLLIASPRGVPFLSFTGLDAPLGSACVEFSRDKDLLETFLCPARFEARYAFERVRAAYRAACSASKVSLRVDAQGVLSMQFLIDVDGIVGETGGVGSRERERVAFVDFRIVPLVDDEDRAQLGAGSGAEDGDEDDGADE